ncbi:MAG: VOC family protein [Rhodobacteraceae bacterium]|jgi:catechol 2,3-dioxygenase-like lactoylglutathione lyase family enzyme|nr:VOC family protein [Paracoccaceae bacterium]
MTRIRAFTLIVPDYPAGLAFYRDVMGFVVTADLDQGHKRWITLRAPDGGPDIVLARADTDAQRRAIGQQGGGRVWLFLETPDFAREHARMTAAGILFEESPRHEAYGIVAVWQDPFGNRWDLIQPAPPHPV